MAGLVTAWELSAGQWRDRFDAITVYQRGWRLGGKGASSRGPHDRIEEHGLHVLLGYYDATFRVLREVYAELDRESTDPDCPIRTWRDAVAPCGDIGLADWHDDTWLPMVTRFSDNDAVPGEPGAEDRTLDPWTIAARSLRLLLDFHRSLPDQTESRVYLSSSPQRRSGRSPLDALVRGAGVTALAALLEAVERASRLPNDLGVTAPVADSLAAVLGTWRDGMRAVVLADDAARRTWQLVDLVVTNLRGMVLDGLLLAGTSPCAYDRIDELDYREWLQRHGAAPETLDCAVVRGMYDLVFAYERGDRARPRFAAGLGLQLAARMLFDFKGSVFWRMQAGMGEVVFAPLYQALVRRGVDVQLWHRLDGLEIDDDQHVAAIRLTRQAQVRSDIGAYEPLVRVDGLPCWPAQPRTEQLSRHPGEAESHSWQPGPDCHDVRLVAEADFDVAVLAVSAGMVPHVAGDLLAADPRWQAMTDHVATVATQAAQLWLEADESALGWDGPAQVTLSGFGDRFDTWASMSHLLPREGWPSTHPPRSLAYLCGAMPEVDPSTASAQVRATLTDYLDHEIGALWPGAVSPRGFRWELLWDDAGRRGPDRLSSQYLRANVDPSDRYVQSLPGTGRYRIPPGDTGFANLAVAGDWTACGLDAGCVEAATRSGVLAARAVLSGQVHPRPTGAEPGACA